MDIKNFQLEMLDDEAKKKLLGIRGWFLKGEKRDELLVSKLVEQEIKNRKKQGEAITKEDIDKIKFEYDPIFKKKIIDKVHKDCDREYNAYIKNVKTISIVWSAQRQKKLKELKNLVGKKLLIKT